MSYRHNILENSEENGYVKSQTERGYLLKYYPKYYHKINLDKIDAPTIRKIKGLKRLHHFAGELSDNKPHDLSLVLLQKVRKDLKTLPKISQDGNDSFHAMKRWYGSKFREVKYFSAVESIEVTRSFFGNPFESPKGGLKNSKGSVNRILIYLANARDLKRIDTLFRYKMPEFLRNKLNLPKKLKAKLSITPHLDGTSGMLSDFALQSSPFSQNIVRMDASRCRISVLKEIATVIEALQDLKSLKIASHQYTTTCQIPEIELKQNTLRFYKALEALSKLEGLSLYLNELVLESLNNFALPKNLEVLKVNLMSSPSLFVPFEEFRSVLNNFCLRIQELPLLDTLCLGLTYLKGDDASRSWDFAVNLLKGIPRLSCLRLELPSYKNEPEEGPIEILDCALIFEGILHLMPVLRELHLDFSTSSDPVAFSPSPKYRFLNLRELSITGYISLPLDLKQILMIILPEDEDSTSSIKQRKLEIGKIMVESREDSEELLRSLNHIGSIKPHHIDLKLHVEFSEDLIMTLVDFIKGLRYIEGLSLYIWLERAMRFNKVLESIKDHLSRLDYLQVREADIDREENFCIFKKGVLIKRYKEDEEDDDYLALDNSDEEDEDDDYLADNNDEGDDLLFDFVRL